MKNLRNPQAMLKAIATGKESLSNFTGASASGETRVPVKFGFKIVNAGVASKVATLCPGLHATNAEIVAAGITSDGIIDDSEFVASFLTGSAQDSQLTIKHFLAFLKEYRFAVDTVTVASNNTEQYDESITLGHSNPFATEGRKTIQINKYFSEYQQNETKVTMRLAKENDQFEMSNLNIVTLPIAKSSTLYVTLSGTAIVRQ